MSTAPGKPGAGPLPAPGASSLADGHGRERGWAPAASSDADPTDIHVGDWVDRWLPRWAAPYARLARLDRPIGTWLLLLPGWWGIALAGPRWPDPVLLVLFAIGAVAMRGAGCTLNDIADRDYDGRVARTRLRPIPSGRVSVRRAAIFMAMQLAAGAAILFSLNRASILLGIAVLALIVTYPFMKRIIYWPQLFLGLNFNWGALIGWTAVTGGLALPPVLLYLGGICWTLGYDTIYAHQDKEDDARIGVKSSALALGDGTRPFLYAAYGAAIVLWGAAGLAEDLDPATFAPFLIVTVFLLLRQAGTVDTDDPADCLRHFRANRAVGLTMFGGMVLGHVL